jgi:putative acetyltransferase
VKIEHIAEARAGMPMLEFIGQGDDFHFRTGALGDAEGIVRVHYAAVHQTASAFYSAEVFDSWSPPPDEARYEQVRRTMTDGRELFLVAEDRVGLVGFGSIAPGSEELRAVYVHPRAARRGVGSTLLRRLETLALGQGCARLHLEASVNAEAFYAKNAYVVLARGVHRLPGVDMACVHMTKALVGQRETT